MYIPSMEYALAILAALADPIRLRSLALMARGGELCVCELTHALQVGQPTISKHLASLREAGLVKDRRHAQWVFNAIASDLPPWVEAMLSATLAGLGDDPRLAEDAERLRTMPARPPRRRAA